MTFGFGGAPDPSRGGISRQNPTTVNADSPGFASIIRDVPISRTIPRDDSNVAALPARPEVRVLDLVRAVDGALIVGDVHGARSLLACVVRVLDPTAEVGAKRTRRGSQ